MTLSIQFLSLLAMIGTGIASGAVIDSIHTTIASSKRASFIRKYRLYIECVGWIVIGFVTFYILYIVRDGAWRIYDPFAQLAGLLLYMTIFHRPFRWVGRIIYLLIIKPTFFIINLMRISVLALFKVIILPFLIIYKGIHRLFCWCLQKSFKIKRN